MKLVLFLAAVLVAQVHGDCDGDWDAHDGNCFKPFILDKPDRLNFEDAQHACEELGATLPTVADPDTNALIQAYLPQPIGDEPRLAIWTGGEMINTTADTMEWCESELPGAEEIITTWRNWFRQSGIFPKDIADSCVSIMNNPQGSWRNPSCETERLSYVCQKSSQCNVDNCVGCVADDYCAKCAPGFWDIYDDGQCHDLALACDIADGWKLMSRESQLCFKLAFPPGQFSQPGNPCGEDFGVPDSIEQSQFVVKELLKPSKMNAWINGFAEDYENTAWVPWFFRFNPARVTDENHCIMVNHKAGSWHNKPCRRSFPYVCKRQWNF